MLIRNFFLSAALCLIFSAVSCSSNTPSEYPSKDHDRAERNMERANREHDRAERNMERANREKESKPPRDMKMAAKQLGVSPEALREALGGPPPDIENGAKILGISEEKLMDALAIREYPDKSGEHKGLHDNNPLQVAADKLGVDLKELRDALGPPPPDVEAAAKKLGIDAEKIREAMAVPPKDR